MKNDFLLRDRNGQTLLVVEVKKRTDATRQWATQIYRNMRMHGLLPESKYFMLITPRRLFLWEAEYNAFINEAYATSANWLEREPNYEVDATRFWESFTQRTGLSVNDLSAESFELLVVSWLSELVQRITSEHNHPSFVSVNDNWLVDSGLMASIQNAQMQAEVYA